MIVQEQAVESALNQKGVDFEVIVVDDYSDKEVSSNEVTVIRNKKNKGSTKSLKIGLNAAKGKYIAILDDDDYWIDDFKLKKQLDFLENNPDYVLVGTNIEVRDKKTDEYVTKSDVPLADKEIRDNFLLHNPFAHSSVMFRREEALEVGDYNEELKYAKDYNLWLMLADIGRVAVLPDCTTVYRSIVYKTDRKKGLKIRIDDTKYKMKVLLMHRNYKHFIRAFSTELFRFFAFSALRIIS